MSQAGNKPGRPRLSLVMNRRDQSNATGTPLPARALVRCGATKVFGGFVLAVPEGPESSHDEVWEVEVTFIKKLGSGMAAQGMDLGQAMCGSFLVDPASL